MEKIKMVHTPKIPMESLHYIMNSNVHWDIVEFSFVKSLHFLFDCPLLLRLFRFYSMHYSDFYRIFRKNFEQVMPKA